MDYVAYHTQLLAPGKRRPDGSGAPDPAWAAGPPHALERGRAEVLARMFGGGPP